MRNKLYNTTKITLSGSYMQDENFCEPIVRIRAKKRSEGYICPICNCMGYPHNVSEGMFRCNTCGVYFEW